MVFPVAWTVLYILMAASLWRLWDRAAEREQRESVAAEYREKGVAARAAADADPDAPATADEEHIADTAQTDKEGPTESAPARARPHWLN